MDEVLIRALPHDEVQLDHVSVLDSLDHYATAGLDGLDRLAIERYLHAFYANPRGNAHSNRFGLLVAQDDLPLERQITLHVHPGRGAVQEEIHLCQAVIETGDPMPGIIECR